MDHDEAVTVCEVNTPSGLCYLLICWLVKSFDLNLYTNNELWKGKFSSDRLGSFSKNLYLTEDAYLARIKRCLSQQRDDYKYEFKNGFFYWKRKFELSVIIEGFLPLELQETSSGTNPQLAEALININKRLTERLNKLQSKLITVKTDYLEYLADTEDFLNMKQKMETFLCEKFLNLACLKKSKIKMLDSDTGVNLKNGLNILIDRGNSSALNKNFSIQKLSFQ